MSNAAHPVNEKESPASNSSPGFFKRYRLPLFLACIAVGLYAMSILFFMYGRGSVA